MRLSIDAQVDSLSARNRVEEARRRAELAKQAKAFEIIGDSGNRNAEEARRRAELAKQAKAFEIIGDSGDGHANDGASEIIQDFPHCHARILDTVTTDGKCLKYKELSGNCHASWRASDPSTPPFRGRNRLRRLSRAVHSSPSPTLPEKTKTSPVPRPSPRPAASQGGTAGPAHRLARPSPRLCAAPATRSSFRAVRAPHLARCRCSVRSTAPLTLARTDAAGVRRVVERAEVDLDLPSAAPVSSPPRGPQAAIRDRRSRGAGTVRQSFPRIASRRRRNRASRNRPGSSRHA